MLIKVLSEVYSEWEGIGMCLEIKENKMSNLGDKWKRKNRHNVRIIFYSILMVGSRVKVPLGSIPPPPPPPPPPNALLIFHAHVGLSDNINLCCDLSRADQINADPTPLISLPFTSLSRTKTLAPFQNFNGTCFLTPPSRSISMISVLCLSASSFTVVYSLQSNPTEG